MSRMNYIRLNGSHTNSLIDNIFRYRLE